MTRNVPKNTELLGGLGGLMLLIAPFGLGGAVHGLGLGLGLVGA